MRNPHLQKDISERILNDIDRWCQTGLQDAKRRTHLGASIIGNECPRQLWYEFRWVGQEELSGQQLRLFNRGHLEEARFVNYLRGIGCVVAEEDPVTGKQFRVSGVNGHFGGSCDGQAILPPDYGYPHPILLEFKTSNDRSFKDMLNKGVAKSKPVHKAQMDLYGLLLGLDFALYMMVNKNDDHLHVEFIELDKEKGEQLLHLAKDIIENNNPPMRAFPATHRGCKWCKFQAHCHYDKPFDVNCRSCSHAHAVEDGNWFCTAHNAIIPEDVIPQGCGQYQPLSNV